MFWKWRVRLNEDGMYHVSDKSTHGTGGREVPLNINGPHQPDVPLKMLTEAEYLRWKADLIDKGDTVDDSLFRL